MNRRFLAIVTLVLIFSFAKGQNAKYVFLFIGDGMGINQVYTTELFLSAQAGQVKDTQLVFNTFPVSSNMTTFSADTYVTGSAAAATAMSTGYKTNNGVLGKSPDLTKDYETFGVSAKSFGYKVGILSSVAIDHATPAGFYAHNESRNNYYEISMELPNYDIDYFGGGGFHYSRGKDGNQPDAYRNAVQKGYTLANTEITLNMLKNGSEKVFAINPELYSLGEFYWEIDNNKDAWSLADFTKKGIEVLDNDKGFFMMVEGGKIDWACHANDAATMVYEVIGFNEAVEVAYEFYKENPDETLIIVTADHETGSLFSGLHYAMKPELLRHQKGSGHEFDRIMSNLSKAEDQVNLQQVMDSIQMYFGLGNSSLGLELSGTDSLAIKQSYHKQFVAKQEVDPDADYLSTTETPSIAEVAVKILNTKAGYGWGSSDHSSMPVPVRVIGAGQQYFTNYFDNTELPTLMRKAMGVE